jgi:hypothetical protein
MSESADARPNAAEIRQTVRDLADEGVLSQWGSDDALAGATYRIVDAGRLDEEVVVTDGGQAPLRRFTGHCDDCDRQVRTAIRRTRQAMCSDPTARARCRECGSTVTVAGDPPADARRARADGGTHADDTERSAVFGDVDPEDRAFTTLKPYEDIAQEIEEYTAELGRDAADGCRSLGWIALGGRSTTQTEDVAETLEAISRNAEVLAEQVRDLDDPREVREVKYGE